MESLIIILLGVFGLKLIFHVTTTVLGHVYLKGYIDALSKKEKTVEAKRYLS